MNERGRGEHSAQYLAANTFCCASQLETSTGAATDQRVEAEDEAQIGAVRKLARLEQRRRNVREEALARYRERRPIPPTRRSERIHQSEPLAGDLVADLLVRILHAEAEQQWAIAQLGES